MRRKARARSHGSGLMAPCQALLSSIRHGLSVERGTRTDEPGIMRATATPPPANSRLQKSADQPHQPTSPTLLDGISHHDRHHAIVVVALRAGTVSGTVAVGGASGAVPGTVLVTPPGDVSRQPTQSREAARRVSLLQRRRRVRRLSELPFARGERRSCGFWRVQFPAYPLDCRRSRTDRVERHHRERLSDRL
jgi:hypothetical protein